MVKKGLLREEHSSYNAVFEDPRGLLKIENLHEKIFNNGKSLI